jgi:hypothetical protein
MLSNPLAQALLKYPQLLIISCCHTTRLLLLPPTMAHLSTKVQYIPHVSIKMDHRYSTTKIRARGRRVSS